MFRIDAYAVLAAYLFFFDRHRRGVDKLSVGWNLAARNSLIVLPLCMTCME